MFKFLLFLIAVLGLVISFFAFVAGKGHSSSTEEVLWGKKYKRRIRMCKGEVQNLSISQSGDGYINALVPSVKGTVELHLPSKLLDAFAKKIEKRDDGNSIPIRILLATMQIGSKKYVAKIPEGKKIFLGEATILTDKRAKDEYDFNDLLDIQDRIKPVLYNRNALLICAVVCLLIGHSFISLLLSIISTYISLNNRLFVPFDIEGTEWEEIDTSRYPAPAADKPDFENGHRLSAAEQKIQEIVEKLVQGKFACKFCGSLIDPDNWQYCPNCGKPIPSAKQNEQEHPGESGSGEDTVNVEPTEVPEEDISIMEDIPEDESSSTEPIDDMDMDVDMADLQNELQSDIPDGNMGMPEEDETFAPTEDMSDEDEETFSPGSLESDDDSFVAPEDEKPERNPGTPGTPKKGKKPPKKEEDDDDTINLLDVDDLPEPEDFRGEAPDGMIDADFHVIE